MLHQVRGALCGLVNLMASPSSNPRFKYVTDAFFVVVVFPDFFFFSCVVFSDTVLTLKMLAATVSIAHPEQSDEKAVQM